MTGPAEHQEEAIHFQPVPPRDLFLSDTPYIMRRNREDGEADLEALTRSETQEEGAWAYSGDAAVWLNMRAQSADPVDDGQFSVGVDTLFFDLAQLGSQVSFYHIHPQTVVDYQSDALVAKLDAPSAEQREECRQISEIYATLPSYLDVGAAVDYVAGSGECELDFKIASPTGLTTFTLNQHHPLFEDLEGEYKALMKGAKSMIIEHGYACIDEINRRMDGALTLSFEPCE